MIICVIALFAAAAKVKHKFGGTKTGPLRILGRSVIKLATHCDIICILSEHYIFVQIW